MKKEILTIALLLIGTTIIWLVVLSNVLKNKEQIVVYKEVSKQDSALILSAYEDSLLLAEQIELYKQLYESIDKKNSTVAAYRTIRDTILVRDTISVLEVHELVNICDSIIAQDSVIIKSYEQQIDLSNERINNLNEAQEIYKNKVETLEQNQSELVKQNEKLKTKNKRRLKTALISTGVAVGSVLLLFL